MKTEANKGAAKTAQSRRGVLWDGVLPEALGLCFVGVVCVGLWAGYVVSDAGVRQHGREAVRQRAEAFAQGVATVLSPMHDATEETLRPIFHELTQLPGVQAVTWTAPDGKLRYAWPRGTPGAPTHAPTISSGPLQAQSVRAPVKAPAGNAAGFIEVVYRPAIANAPRSSLLWGWGVASAAILLAFVAAYGWLRQRTRPLAAIERNLQSVASDLETELATLTLSDALGVTAKGWNALITQLDELRHKIDKAGSVAQADVMARFESTIFRRVVDRMPFGVVCLEDDQRVRYANASAAVLLNRAGDDLTGQPVAELIDNPAIAQSVDSVRARPGASITVDHTIEQDEDQASILRFRVMALSAQPGSGSGLLITIEDISALRENERARDNFLYHVTHELRTPLTNIQAYTETLTQPGFDDEQTRKECYNVIISETHRLSQLVENILSISQLEVGTARLDLGDVDLARLIRQMVQDNLGAADEKGIDLMLSLPPKMPKVKGDKQRLCVLLNNLIGNAVKYTPRGGQVQVNVDVGEYTLKVAVQDTGLGIAPEDQTRVFEKFYRAADDNVQQITGTGLGLALAREVARLHGGDIHLESEPGVGSTFTVELPAHAGEETEVALR